MGRLTRGHGNYSEMRERQTDTQETLRLTGQHPGERVAEPREGTLERGGGGGGVEEQRPLCGEPAWGVILDI